MTRQLKSKFEICLLKELEVYSERYERELRNQGIPEEDINKKVKNWIDETFDFYKKNDISIEDAIKIFDFLNYTGAQPQTEAVDDNCEKITTIKK